jgi:DUF1365 family protein
MVAPEFVQASTWHGRIGQLRNTFRYRLDFVLIDPESAGEGPLFRRNRRGVASVHDRDHGGAPGAGAGAAWARQVLATAGLPAGFQLRLLTQPRWLGMVFNPVSFWLAFRDDALVAAIAEVNNTYGDRHSYICAQPGFAPILPGDVITARKVFHVSPFLDIAGRYAFSFRVDPDAIAIRIAFRDGADGLVATLEGSRLPMTGWRVLRGALRFPFAGVRATALIFWQALRLRRKGAPFRTRPLPPDKDVTA